MATSTLLRHCRLTFLAGLFVFCRCNCPFYHGEITTYATLYLTLQNKTDAQIKAVYHRPREFMWGDSTYIVDSSRILFKNDTLSCAGRAVVSDTIEYKFPSADYCDIVAALANDLRLELKIFRDDTLYKVSNVLPWDTTVNNGYEELDNCHKESWDTLIVE